MRLKKLFTIFYTIGITYGGKNNVENHTYHEENNNAEDIDSDEYNNEEQSSSEEESSENERLINEENSSNKVFMHAHSKSSEGIPPLLQVLKDTALEIKMTIDLIKGVSIPVILSFGPEDRLVKINIHKIFSTPEEKNIKIRHIQQLSKLEKATFSVELLQLYLLHADVPQLLTASYVDQYYKEIGKESPLYRMCEVVAMELKNHQRSLILQTGSSGSLSPEGSVGSLIDEIIDLEGSLPVTLALNKFNGSSNFGLKFWGNTLRKQKNWSEYFFDQNYIVFYGNKNFGSRTLSMEVIYVMSSKDWIDNIVGVINFKACKQTGNFTFSIGIDHSEKQRFLYMQLQKPFSLSRGRSWEITIVGAYDILNNQVDKQSLITAYQNNTTAHVEENIETILAMTTTEQKNSMRQLYNYYIKSFQDNQHSNLLSMIACMFTVRLSYSFPSGLMQNTLKLSLPMLYFVKIDTTTILLQNFSFNPWNKEPDTTNNVLKLSFASKSNVPVGQIVIASNPELLTI